MDELKFRVYDKKNKKWLRDDDWVINAGSIYADWRDFEDGISLKEEDVCVMPFTEYKDIEDKTIYPGDICKIQRTGDKGVISGSVRLGISIRPSDEDGVHDLDWIIGDVKVIGNIYDNPELLENGDAD